MKKLIVLAALLGLLGLAAGVSEASLVAGMGQWNSDPQNGNPFPLTSIDVNLYPSGPTNDWIALVYNGTSGGYYLAPLQERKNIPSPLLTLSLPQGGERTSVTVNWSGDGTITPTGADNMRGGFGQYGIITLTAPDPGAGNSATVYAFFGAGGGATGATVAAEVSGGNGSWSSPATMNDWGIKLFQFDYSGGALTVTCTSGGYENYPFYQAAALIIQEVPEPGTLLLLGTGALGAIGYVRRRIMK